MARQSISFTPPNDQWLKAQVDSREYSSKSEVVNDLIRRAREVEATRARLIQAELSGFTELSQDEILKQAKGSMARGEL
jgi:antitoxin ParD1/3/4